MIKKITQSIILLFMIAIPSFMYAQGVGFGLKGGVNFANQSITNITTESITGFHGGGYFVLAFSESWAVQPEVFFSSQGAELPELDELNEFNYLSIPVLLSLRPLSFLSIEAGPQISLLLDAKNRADNSIKDDFNRSDIGLAAGITLHSPIGLNGGLRYVWGLTNISNLENDLEVKNRMVQIFLGWTIFGANK